PADPMQTLGRHDARMLKVALAPTPVADGKVDDRGRRLLEGSLEIVGNDHRPAGATNEGCLDEIMTENMPTEGWLAAEQRQAGSASERLAANDGVVAPIIALAAAPPGEPAGNHRPVDAAGKLMQAREERFPVHQARHRLHQPGVRIGFDPPR